MAKGKKAPPASRVAPEVVEQPLQDAPLQKINIYDSGAVKHSLDEAARQVILDSGFDEDNFVGNVKIALGFLAIGTALYSHLLPGKFPTNWWSLLYCVVSYFAFTAALAVFTARAEGDAFILTRKETGNLRLSSQLARFSTEYHLSVEDRDAAGKGGATSTPLKRTFDISRLFHSDGYLSEAAWRDEVTALLNEFFAEDEGPAASSRAGNGRGSKGKKTN